MKTKKTLDELRRYVDVSKYDINDKVQMIIIEVENMLKKWEQEARRALGMEEKSSTFSETNPSSLMKNGK